MAIWELKCLSTFKMEINTSEFEKKKEKKKKGLVEVQSKDNFSYELLFLYLLSNNWNAIIGIQSINKFIVWIKVGQITSMPKNKRGQAMWQPQKSQQCVFKSSSYKTKSLETLSTLP